MRVAHPFMSDAWARAYGAQIQASADYRRAAATWEGAIVLKVLADPALGIPAGRGIYLDLYHGECRAAREATADDLAEAPYVITADAYTWKQVIDKRLEPIAGLLHGKLKLERGDMVTLARYVEAAMHLVDAATRVETVFPEGLQ